MVRCAVVVPIAAIAWFAACAGRPIDRFCERDCDEATALEAASIDGGGSRVDASLPRVRLATALAAADSGGGTDALVSADGAPLCAPTANPNFAPVWKLPKQDTAACTASVLDLLIDCAFDPQADAQTCHAVADTDSGKACEACAFTNRSATKYGPLIVDPTKNVATLNVAGCVALKTADLTAVGCGAKIWFSDECTFDACAASCGKGTGYLSCINAAETKLCASYTNAAQCSVPLVAPGGAADGCAFDGNFIVTAKRLGKVFCAH